MQLSKGLLLFTFAFLLHDVFCSTTEGPSSLKEAEALAQANANEASQTGNHLGEVSVNNGNEMRAEVQTSDLHGNGMEVNVQELQADVENGDVQPTGNLADMLEHIAAEYTNGTREGLPSKFHSELEVGVDNSTANSMSRGIQSRQAYPTSKQWTDGIIPYSFTDVRAGESGVPDFGQTNIMNAMKFFEATTCLRFPLWTSTVHAEYNLTHSNFLRYIVPDRGGCWSSVGKTGGTGQAISCCNGYGVCLHEIGHALGLLHEQDRSDRDNFVSMHPENADPKYTWVFNGAPYTGGVNIHPYDYGSMMHYSMYGFSYNGKKTLDIIDDEEEYLLGNSEGDISHYDLMGISNYYDCTKNCPADKKALKCQNDGFIDVHCKCKCSELFTGDLCEEIYTPSAVTAWPTGSWGIPDSKDGCPTTGTWATGSRTHATEWGSSQYSGYLKPFSLIKIVDHFCMKSDAASGSGDWPAGTYCIYQQGDSCPTGFQSGSITYDDENTRAAAENAINGSLPKGVYDENTKYFYCCRDDGSADTPIALPRDKPFHLFSYRGKCQSVTGMLDTSFYMRYDQENTSPVSASTDPHPSTNGWYSDVWLYYCYYKPISYEGCGGIIDLTDSNPSINISSPNYPQNYNDVQDCTWLVKAPEGKHLVLDFNDFDLEEDSNKNCLDSVEIRYTLIGQPGEYFCGNGFKRSVISPAGFIIMIMRTGFSGTRKGFSSTVRIVSDAEQCTSPDDFGNSYRGNVDYTQHYDKCIPWEEAQHCTVNAFSDKYIFSGLVGHSNCRNPNNLIHPWCYINTYCDIDFCDVCGISRCYDYSGDCAELLVHEPDFCSSKRALKLCHKSCNLCGRGHEKTVSSCPAPVVKDKNAVIEPAKANQTTFAFGEKVKIECKDKVDNVKITSELMCTTDGKYEGMEMICGIMCPDGWKRFRENCYKFTDTKLHYKEAIKACEAENAVITGIADAEENEFVRQLVGGSTGWIGYHDMDYNDEWEWVDGVKRNYTNWRPDQPSAGNERCTIIQKDGFWNDIYCPWHYPQRSVCKRKHQGEYESDYYCVDEEPNSFDIISRNYQVCKQYGAYAFAKSRRSCGVCPEMECPNPGLVPNTVQKVKDLYITAGEYFKYECISGYELFSGNLGRTCVRNGTISGTAPVCKPEAEFQDTYGFRVIRRAKTEAKHKLTVYDFGSNIDRDGKVVRWDVYSGIRSTIMAQVWRLNNGTFTLIGQNLLTLRAKVVNTYTLKSFEGYYVKKGDLIGWYTPRTQGIKYSDCRDSYANRTIYQTTVSNMDEVKVGMQKTLPLVDKCRTYSIAVTIGAGGIGSYFNVAAASRGGTCIDASENKDSCGLAIDGGLLPFSDAWLTNPASRKSVGSFITIKFDGKFQVVGAKFMQRLSKSGQNKELTLTFSDGSTQQVGLSENQGTSAMDTTAAVWNAFELSEVFSDSIKVTVDSVYSTDQNGFIEIEIYGGCLEGYTLNKESCYKKEETTKTWLDAEAACQADSSHLVTINSEEENAYIASLRAGYTLWIGLNDRLVEDTWEWADGSNYSFTMWDGTPNNYNNQDCVEMYINNLWNDLDCEALRYSVCEKHLDAVKPTGEEIQGNPVQPRAKVDSSGNKGYIYMEGSVALTISKKGSIKSWKLYSDSDNDITMMVLRPQSDKYTLVGETTVSIRGKVTNIISIASFDRIQVQPGDLIAWYYLPGQNPAIPYDVCSSSTQQAKYIKHPTSEPLVVGQTLTGTVASNPCRTYSISYTLADEQPVLENVATLTYYGTCSGASSRQSICDLVLDGKLTDWDSSWVPDSPPTGQNLDIQLSEMYSLAGGRIMQRMSATAQIKTLKLEFGDGITKEVTLRKRQGSGDGDFSAQIWDTFSLDESVDTSSVKITITELYPQSKADSKVGIIEVQLIANGCPVNWTKYEENCYRKQPTTQFYSPSEKACQDWGAHVSTVKDQAENDFLVKMAPYQYLGYTWDDSEWVSSDGSAVNYTNWKTGEPNGASNSEYCISTQPNGEWIDQYCQWYYAKPVICKKGIKRLAQIVNVGGAAESRQHTTGRPRIFIPDRPEFIFNQAGRIFAWKVFGVQKSVAILSVYRRVINETNKFRHVGSNTIETEEGRMSYIKVPEGFQINVLPGDIIGIQTPNGDSGVTVDYCDNSVAQMDTWELKNTFSNPEPGEVLTFTSMKSVNYYPCRMYSMNALVEEVKEKPVVVNIGSAGLGATCEASDNAADCGKVIDDDMAPSSEWKVTASPVTGNWIKVTFSESYPVEYISIMQRFGSTGQSQDITLEFSNSSSQTVTLKQRTGGSFTDPKNGFWDDFQIDKVDTTFIKFTISTVYTESENGFVEIRVYASCPTNYERYKDHCYELVKEKPKYFPAHDRCVAHGAKLVRVDDADENKFLRTLPGDEKIWIGFRDNYVAKPNAVWSWEGNPANYTYTNWAPGQPAASATWGYCATLDTDGLWREHYCKWYNYYWFVCEKNAPGIGGAKKRDVEMQSIGLETDLESGLNQHDATPPPMSDDSIAELRDGPNDVTPPPMEGDSDSDNNGATPPAMIIKLQQDKRPGRLARMRERLNID